MPALMALLTMPTGVVIAKLRLEHVLRRAQLMLPVRKLTVARPASAQFEPRADSRLRKVWGHAQLLARVREQARFVATCAPYMKAAQPRLPKLGLCQVVHVRAHIALHGCEPTETNRSSAAVRAR